MTDNEIVKALECCGSDEIKFCSICPCYLQNPNNDFCQEDLSRNALDLIKRQQAEIEELQEILGGTAKVQSQTCAVVRVEAIKEFAERLQAISREHTETNARIVYERQIDNLVKEMTGESKC